MGQGIKAACRDKTGSTNIVMVDQKEKSAGSILVTYHELPSGIA